MTVFISLSLCHSIFMKAKLCRVFILCLVLTSCSGQMSKGDACAALVKLQGSSDLSQPAEQNRAKAQELYEELIKGAPEPMPTYLKSLYVEDNPDGEAEATAARISGFDRAMYCSS